MLDLSNEPEDLWRDVNSVAPVPKHCRYLQYFRGLTRRNGGAALEDGQTKSNAEFLGAMRTASSRLVLGCGL